MKWQLILVFFDIILFYAHYYVAWGELVLDYYVRVRIMLLTDVVA